MKMDLRTVLTDLCLAPGVGGQTAASETAQRLLTYTRKSVKEIAAALGFSDQYYFSGCFKARTGVSPTAYRSGK
mgnify:CR=1 FL=1